MNKKINKLIKTKSLFTLMLLLGCYSLPSFAVLSLVYDPYDVVQNTITAKNSVESLINQAKQLQCEVENLKKLSTGHFEDTGYFLRQLADVFNEGESLSYALNDIEQRFDKTFPGITNPLNYYHDFTRWSSATHDTLKDALISLSLQGRSFEGETSLIKELQTASEHVSGNLQAQQTTHRIELQQISQLQKLRQLLLNQASSQTTYMAYQLQKEQATQASVHEWIQKSQVSFKHYDGQTGFGSPELPNLP